MQGRRRGCNEKWPFCLTTNDCSVHSPVGTFSAYRTSNLEESRVLHTRKQRAKPVSAEWYLGHHCLLVMLSLCSARCEESHSQRLPWSQTNTCKYILKTHRNQFNLKIVQMLKPSHTKLQY